MAKNRNNKKIWFRRKQYGWGWFPVSWQGWFALLVYVALMVFVAVQSNLNANSVSDVLISFAVPYILITSALIIVCYVHGEEPRWQWGRYVKE